MARTLSASVTPSLTHDTSADVMAAALRNLIGVGDVEVSRSDTISAAYGFDWTITFLELVGPRALLSINDDDISSDGSITSEVNHGIVGTLPFTGNFSLCSQYVKALLMSSPSNGRGRGQTRFRQLRL